MPSVTHEFAEIAIIYKDTMCNTLVCENCIVNNSQRYFANFQFLIKGSKVEILVFS